MLKRRVMLMLLGAALLLLPALPAGATIYEYSSYAGDGPAFEYEHEIFEVTFTVGATCDVRIWTHSMYDPGTPIPIPDMTEANSNFYPMLWVWSGTGDSATLLTPGWTVFTWASSPDPDSSTGPVVDWNTQVFPRGLNNTTQGDAGVLLPSLAPGTYMVSLTVQGNAPYDYGYENPVLRSSGWNWDDVIPYPEAWTPLSDFDETGDWRLSIDVPKSAVPIPGSLILLGTGLAGLFLARRKRS